MRIVHSRDTSTASCRLNQLLNSLGSGNQTEPLPSNRRHLVRVANAPTTVGVKPLLYVSRPSLIQLEHRHTPVRVYRFAGFHAPL